MGSMKLLKLIIFIFIIYLIRRFFQAYKVMKEIQESNLRAQAQAQAEASARTQPAPQGKAHNPNEEVVEADFRVID